MSTFSRYTVFDFLEAKYTSTKMLILKHYKRAQKVEISFETNSFKKFTRRGTQRSHQSFHGRVHQNKSKPTFLSIWQKKIYKLFVLCVDYLQQNNTYHLLFVLTIIQTHYSKQFSCNKPLKYWKKNVSSQVGIEPNIPPED